MDTNDELKENSEHAKEPFDRKVAVTMAVIAAALAIVSVLGHIFANEELLLQQKASDQWAYYQAKSIRRYSSEIAKDFAAAMGEAGAKVGETYTKNAEKYRQDSDEIKKEAEGLEAESALKGKHALRLHFGEIFLEMGIVFASLAILTKQPIVWWACMGTALIGMGVALSSLWV